MSSNFGPLFYLFIYFIFIFFISFSSLLYHYMSLFLSQSSDFSLIFFLRNFFLVFLCFLYSRSFILHVSHSSSLLNLFLSFFFKFFYLFFISLWIYMYTVSLIFFYFSSPSDEHTNSFFHVEVYYTF